MSNFYSRIASILLGKYMKRFLVLPLLLLINYAQANAHHANPITSSSAKSFIVYDFSNDKILQEKNSSEVRPIASLTKLMTANVFLNHQPHPELCSSHVSEEDIDYLKHTHSRLPKGDSLTCDKLLNAMLISSDNMAASALSRSINNYSKNQFIGDMNTQAQQIGMKNTYYSDSSGLSPNNRSTVKDLLALIKRSLTNTFITKTTAKKNSLVIAANGHIIDFKNTNKLIREYGLNASLSKTGYIKESGYNLIYVHKDLCQNKKIGFVLLGAVSSASRSAQAMNILKNYGCPMNNSV